MITVLITAATSLIFILTFALWPLLKLLKINFAVNKLNPLQISAAISIIYIIALFVTLYFLPDTHRWLNNFMGVVTFAFFITIAYWLIYFIAKLFDQQQFFIGKGWALGVLGLTFALSAYSSYQFHRPVSVEEFHLSSDKITKPYRFVQLSDIQFGTSTKSEMDDILRLAYAQNPDFIVFTGDLIDFDHYQFSDFELLAASPVPVFFERGNHEFYHHPEMLLEYLKKLAPLKVLINQSTAYGELQIIGLDFSRVPNNVKNQLAEIKVDPDKYSILLYHEPSEVEVAASHNIDLLLYGHTHAGQMWPYTWIVDVMYKYGDGAKKVGNSFAYTSDGASLWGPRMRLGSQNEIIVFNLHPESVIQALD